MNTIQAVLNPNRSFTLRWTVLLMVCLAILSENSLMAQNDKPVSKNKTYLSLQSLQTGAGSITLNARLVEKIEKKRQPLAGATIQLFVKNDSTKLKLGEMVTDQDGRAVVVWSVEPGDLVMQQLKDTAGYWNFGAVYKGDETRKSKKKSIAIRQLDMQVAAGGTDSVHALSFSLSDGGEAVPKTDAVIYVDRLFSKLPVAEGYTNKRGADEVEIPDDVPGDSQGNLIFTVMVEDHEEYGNVSRSITLPWGIPVIASEGPARALWSPNAPLWMIITFAILMTGVWYHYLLIIYKLWRINKEGKTT